MAIGSVVSEKGLVVIPKEIRERFGIKKGDRIQFLDWGGRIVVVPISKDPIEASFGMLKGGGSMEEFLKEKREELREEERGLPPPRKAR